MARWYFDSAAGAEELINRRVGENELSTIQSCLAFVDAEQEYYLRNVQKDPLQHYANKLISTEGKKDGLYWPRRPTSRRARWAKNSRRRAPKATCSRRAQEGAPYHGYIYRMLTARDRTPPVAPMTTWSMASC